MKSKVYVVSGETWSGDSYLYAWKKAPTKAEIEAVMRRDWPSEFGTEDDPSEDNWTIDPPDRAKEVETEDE